MSEEKHVIAVKSWIDTAKDESGEFRVVNVVLDMENIKELIRGENVEVINEDFGQTAIVIRIDDQEST